MCSRRRRQRRQMTETSTDQRTGSRRGRACAMMTLSRNDASSATRHRVVGGSCSVKMTTWNHEWKWKCRNIKFVDSSLTPVVGQLIPAWILLTPSNWGSHPSPASAPTHPAPGTQPRQSRLPCSHFRHRGYKNVVRVLLRWTKRPCKNLFIRD